MTKINFREITIEDKDWIKARLAEDNDNSCERSFTTIFYTVDCIRPRWQIFWGAVS